MSQEAVSVAAPEGTWQVLGPANKTQVFPLQDVTLLFSGGTGTIPKFVPLKTLGITPQAAHVDLTNGAPYLIVGTSGGGVGWLIPEAQFATIGALLTAAGISANWAPIRRVMRTHHVDFQQF